MVLRERPFLGPSKKWVLLLVSPENQQKRTPRPLTWPGTWLFAPNVWLVNSLFPWPPEVWGSIPGTPCIKKRWVILLGCWGFFLPSNGFSVLNHPKLNIWQGSRKQPRKGLEFPFHGCCWETFYIFAYCGLVVEIQIHLAAQIRKLFAPLPTSTQFVCAQQKDTHTWLWQPQNWNLPTWRASPGKWRHGYRNFPAVCPSDRFILSPQLLPARTTSTATAPTPSARRRGSWTRQRTRMGRGWSGWLP